MRAAFLAILLAGHALAETPQPKPPIPTSVAFTQGTVTRTLPVSSANCTDYRATPINGPHGQVRFRMICGTTSQASWVQFDADAGPIYAAFLWPAQGCGQKPAPASQHVDCVAPLVGPGWTQTHDWTCSAGSWVPLPWTPTDPPAGACSNPQPPGWQVAVNVSGDPMIAKPARGVTLTNRYGTSINRISDHAADVPGVGMIREDYSRREPVNADGTRLLAGYNDEYWYVYDISDPAHARFLTQLVGPVGDAELQWDPVDPNALYYLPINGGTVLKKLDIRTNASTVVWDFTSAVQALWPTARRCWTKSEGSPSADNRFWGLMCETDGFAPLGFVVLDIVNKTVTWSMNNSVRPDHVSMTPSGRWFEVSGDDPRGTIFYGVVASNLGQTRQGHHKSEHSDIGSCSGFDFYASVDFQTNNGDIFWINLEDASVTRHVVGYIYGHPNPWFGTNYAIHVSAKAFGKCGFLTSNYGVPPANIVWWDMSAPVNTPYGVGVNYAIDQNYFDEVQAAISRDGKSFFYNDNFGGPSQSGDVYRGTMPQ